MWTYELLTRSGNVLFIIYHDGETIGSLSFPEDNKEYLELWKMTINNLNKVEQVEKQAEKSDQPQRS